MINCFCILDVDECSVMFCKNGGLCINLINDYSCKCIVGFEGKDCLNGMCNN